jgi:hypothetical protein
MARFLGDPDFAEHCRSLFTYGSRWMDEHLFNGAYYEHQVRAPASADAVAAGLTCDMGGQDVTRPAYQLAEGCLVDQLVGQYMAHVCGLGHLHRRPHVRRPLRSIYRQNRKQGFHDHFNPMRSYVLGDESALVMASYPGTRPEQPFPYFREVMTGFEYTAAAGMLFEGLEREGLQCIRDVRARYDGRRRNPFDETECGRHYARAMASWAAVLALTGFRYSAVEQKLWITSRPGTYVWSTGRAWGTAVVAGGRRRPAVTVTVGDGELAVRSVEAPGAGRHALPRRRVLKPGRPATFPLEESRP